MSIGVKINITLLSDKLRCLGSVLGKDDRKLLQKDGSCGYSSYKQAGLTGHAHVFCFYSSYKQAGLTGYAHVFCFYSSYKQAGLTGYAHVFCSITQSHQCENFACVVNEKKRQSRFSPFILHAS